MLVGNGVRTNSNPMRQMMSATAGTAHRAESMQSGALRNWFTHTRCDAKSGRPDGVRHPQAWLMARTPGGMSARNNTTITLTPDGLNVAGGVNATGTAPIVISVPAAQLQLLAFAVGSAAFVFTPSATIAGALAAQGSVAISTTVATALLGALSSTAGSLAIAVSPTGSLAGALAASGTIPITVTTVASLDALGAMIGAFAAALTTNAVMFSALYASGTIPITATLSAAVLQSLGNMIGTIPISVADSATLRADGFMAGTTEEAVGLTADAVASAVWAAAIEAGVPAEGMLRLIAAAVMGESDGAPNGPIAFLGIDGATVRIHGDADSYGNRSNVALNPT